MLFILYFYIKNTHLNTIYLWVIILLLSYSCSEKETNPCACMDVATEIGNDNTTASAVYNKTTIPVNKDTSYYNKCWKKYILESKIKNNNLISKTGAPKYSLITASEFKMILNKYCEK